MIGEINTKIKKSVRIEAYEKLDAEDLDVWVHDAASHMASQINNEGLESQIKFLEKSFGTRQTENILRNLLLAQAEDKNG